MEISLMKNQMETVQNIRTRHWDSCFIDDNAGKGSIIFHKMTWLSARQDFHLEWESVETACYWSIRFREQDLSNIMNRTILWLLIKSSFSILLKVILFKRCLITGNLCGCNFPDFLPKSLYLKSINTEVWFFQPPHQLKKFLMMFIT